MCTGKGWLKTTHSTFLPSKLHCQSPAPHAVPQFISQHSAVAEIKQTEMMIFIKYRDLITQLCPCACKTQSSKFNQTSINIITKRHLSSHIMPATTIFFSNTGNKLFPLPSFEFTKKTCTLNNLNLNQKYLINSELLTF